MTTKAPLELPVRAAHEASGAQFDVIHGWNLPRRYSNGTITEYEALRGDAAITERTHHSRLMVTGADAIDVLDAIFDGYIRELEEDRTMQTFCVDAAGHVSDIVSLSRTGGIAYLISGQPERGNSTRELLGAATADGYDIRVDDRTQTTCSLAIVGPQAVRAVSKFVSPDLPRYLRPGHLVTFEFHGFRSSVTFSDGDGLGYEFMLAPQVASHLWESAAAGGLVPAGFDAVEIARIEDGHPAWTQDLATGLTPEGAGFRPGETKSTLVRLAIDGKEAVTVGAQVMASDLRIGSVTSSVSAIQLDGTAALAVIDSSNLPSRPPLQVDGRDATIEQAGTPS